MFNSHLQNYNRFTFCAILKNQYFKPYKLSILLNHNDQEP